MNGGATCAPPNRAVSVGTSQAVSDGESTGTKEVNKLPIRTRRNRSRIQELTPSQAAELIPSTKPGHTHVNASYVRLLILEHNQDVEAGVPPSKRRGFPSRKVSKAKNATRQIALADLQKWAASRGITLLDPEDDEEEPLVEAV